MLPTCSPCAAPYYCLPDLSSSHMLHSWHSCTVYSMHSTSHILFFWKYLKFVNNQVLTRHSCASRLQCPRCTVIHNLYITFSLQCIISTNLRYILFLPIFLIIVLLQSFQQCVCNHAVMCRAHSFTYMASITAMCMSASWLLIAGCHCWLPSGYSSSSSPDTVNAISVQRCAKIYILYRTLFCTCRQIISFSKMIDVRARAQLSLLCKTFSIFQFLALWCTLPTPQTMEPTSKVLHISL